VIKMITQNSIIKSVKTKRGKKLAQGTAIKGKWAPPLRNPKRRNQVQMKIQIQSPDPNQGQNLQQGTE